MKNQLQYETSPYLLQHAHNPVHWYPWCEEAFRKAKEENKPIFLSIGYSTCHWCHVMAHESFEDETTAKILNKHFVSIKVDREERPDIDSVYMEVCQAFTGSGGWPMSIFMTWDKKPFFAGTYFPLQSRYGMPAFSDLLREIADVWEHHPSEFVNSAENMIHHLQKTEDDPDGIKGDNLVEQAVNMFSHTFDNVHGGFGSAPKFPTPHNILFLLFYATLNQDSHALEMAEKTLLQMRKGGIFDHIGYGFSRYSTDKYFLAPHFEKMLYDNALLIIAYGVAYCITKKNFYLDTAEKTAEYILREMTSCDGGFYSAQDADSEGVEGKYYTFTQQEIINILGEEKGKQFAQTFDIRKSGNFEGVNIPNLLKSNEITMDFSEEIQKLYHYRKHRTHLHLDDKILISWNSMMITALSMLYRISGKDTYLQAAQQAQQMIEKNLCSNLQLYTSFREGKHSERGFFTDYAFYIAALIELYDATLEKDYLTKAILFCDETVKRFQDGKRGGFYLCELDRTELFMNPKETYDGAIPSGNSIMAYNLVRLYQITEREEYNPLLEHLFSYLSYQSQSYPVGHCMFLIAKMMRENPPEHITIALKEETNLQEIRKKIPFFANIAIASENKDYPVINGKTTYYICKNHSCLPPTNTLENDR